MPSVSRREFLQSTALAAAASLTPATLLSQPSQIPDWAAKPQRWMQLTLVEDDPAHFDLGFWLDYFRRTRSDAVCLSGGGCVAYYPTQIPLHHRSAWLNDRDILGELISGCRKLNMTVLVRTDPHGTYDDTAAAHPDWIAVDASGKPRRHWASPEMWVTCAYGPYNFEFMTSVHKEIMSRYRPDGIFLNRWDGSGDCYCIHCQQGFKSATGLDLPRVATIKDPARRAYHLWRQQRLLALLDLWNSEVRAINPPSSMVPNNTSGALNPLDDIEMSRRVPMSTADRQARRGLAAPWLIGKTGKEFRATMGGKPAIGLFGVGLEEPYRWKDSVTSPAEIRIWALDAIANGMRPWCSKFSATLHDERWLKGVEELYLWSENNQAWLKDRQPLARIGLVYSQQTAWYYGDQQAEARVENYALGWYQALVESRIPFEMVHDRLLDRLLDPSHLATYKTLILPNIAALSDAQCDQLRAFVQRGGSLVATYETSLYNEFGEQRKDFGLADLLGVTWAGKQQGPMQNSYLQLEHQALPGHPIFAGLEDAPRIINGVSRLEVTPRHPFAQTPLTLSPSYPDLPMEKVYPRTSNTGISCLFLNQPGQSQTSLNQPGQIQPGLTQPGGRVAYFPFDIDRTFWEVLSPDHLKLLRNTLLWAHNEPPILEVTGRGFLDVTAWQNPRSLTIHLVNMTNPMAMKGPYRDFFPVGPQTITLRPPVPITANQARLLASNQTIPITRTGATIQLTIPQILDHEVIAIET